MDVRASGQAPSCRRDHRRASAQGVNLNVRTTPEADNHVRAIDEWWRRNRTAAPSLFLDELGAAFARSLRRPTSDIRIEDRPSEARDGCCWRAVGTTSTTRRSTTNWSFWQCGMLAAEADHHFASPRLPRPSLRGHPMFRHSTALRSQCGVYRELDATRRPRRTSSTPNTLLMVS